MYEQIEDLFNQGNGSITWAKEWAKIHDQLGIVCWGFPSWAAWAEDVEKKPLADAGRGCLPNGEDGGEGQLTLRGME